MASTTNATKEAAKPVQNGQTSVSEASAPPLTLKQEVKVVALNSFGGLRSVKVEGRPEPEHGEGSGVDPSQSHVSLTMRKKLILKMQ